MQSFYSGFERIFTMIASQIDEHVPTGEHWHKELLRQMVTEIKHIRPQVISEDLKEKVDSYRWFSHLVRNLYAFNFSQENIEKLIVTLPQYYAKLQQEITAFLESIEKQALT